MQRPFVIVVLASAALAVTLLCVAGWLARGSMQLRDEGDHVRGTVVGMERHRDSEGDVTWRPVYEFSYQGERRRHESNVGSSSRPEIGRRETLLVDPTDPERVRANTFMDLWFLPALFGGIGLVFLLVDLLVLFPLFRRISRANEAASSTSTTPTSNVPDGRNGPFL